MALNDSIAARNAKAKAIADLCDAGTLNPSAKLVIRSATGTTLASHDLSLPAFKPPQNGTIVANPISQERAIAIGRAATFSILNRDEEMVYMGSVGTDSSADLVLPELDVTEGATIIIFNLFRTEL